MFAVAVMVTVTAVTYLTTPTYEATARIEIDPPGEVFSLEGGASASDAEYLETEAQVLQTDNLAIDVIQKMRLDQNPELVGARSMDRRLRRCSSDCRCATVDARRRKSRWSISGPGSR